MPRISIRQPNKRQAATNKPMPHTFVAGGMVRAAIDSQPIRTVRPVLRLATGGPEIDAIFIKILPDLYRSRRLRSVALFRNVTASGSPVDFDLTVNPVTADGTNLAFTATRRFKVRRGPLLTVLPGAGGPAAAQTACDPATQPAAVPPVVDAPTFDYPPSAYIIEEGEREYFICFGGTDSVVTSVSLGSREADYKETVLDSSNVPFFWWAEFINLLTDPGAGNHELNVFNLDGAADPRTVNIDDE